MDFLKDFKKQVQKAGLEEGSLQPPRYWYSTGNYLLNKILSGSYFRGVPQGRITCFTGPSGAGKSFIVSNVIREAQKRGAHIVVLDSENALDDEFVQKIGVDPATNYNYIGVTTIPDVQKVVSSFLKGYKEEYKGDYENAPEVLFAIDSLDMLLTDTESQNFAKGDVKGDQGQRNKQLKAMLRQFVQAIKHYNISMVVTSQVYKNQDITNGEGVWVVSDAIKYSLSQIALLTKLKLRKDKGSSEIDGIRMKVHGYKTRFTKPFQSITVEVPYDTGMDPYNGLLDVAIDIGVVERRGAWCYMDGKKWQGSDVPEEHKPRLLELCEQENEKFIEALTDDEEDPEQVEESARMQRAKKVQNS